MLYTDKSHMVYTNEYISISEHVECVKSAGSY